MIHKLPQVDYDRVRPLFQPLIEYQPFCAAVLAGLHPGRVYVDDLDRPQAAFLTRGDPWCFLAGNPSNDAFNRALNRAIFDREIIGVDSSLLLFTCHPSDWHGQLTVVSAPRSPLLVPRRHYVCRRLAHDWRAHLPEGFALQRMDEALLGRSGLKIPDEVRETIEKWRALAGPEFKDYGFVTIHGDEVASWATVDAIVDGVGDIGFFTVEVYRQRGLATVTAAAAIDYGLTHGLSMISWTCAESNVGSIRTAEKLGLERERNYRMYCLYYDEAHELAQIAYTGLSQGHYQETIKLYERFLALRDDPPAWAYHDAARAWAGLGNREQALKYLRTAADRGWTDLAETKSCREFEILHEKPEWADLLERLAKNYR